MTASIVFSILASSAVSLSFSIFVYVINTLSARPRGAYRTIHSYSEASSGEFVLSLCASCLRARRRVVQWQVRQRRQQFDTMWQLCRGESQLRDRTYFYSKRINSVIKTWVNRSTGRFQQLPRSGRPRMTCFAFESDTLDRYDVAETRIIMTTSVVRR